MTIRSRLRQIAEALPSDSSSVTFTRADLVALIEASDAGGAEAPTTRDLTVSEVAEQMQRATSTVRGWLISGELRGYKLNRRDWRVPRDALREYLAGQATTTEVPETRRAIPVDISAWRNVRP